MLTRKDRKIKNQEAKIENRNILISDLQKKNEEQRELIDRIKRIATSNAYNNEKSYFRKNKRTNFRCRKPKLVHNINLYKFISILVYH